MCFIAGKFKLGSRYDEQLGDVLQILLAFYFLSLGDFGISPRLCKTIWDYPQGSFTLWRNLYILMIFVTKTSSVVGEQGYGILKQTGVELMFCHSFCFSIYRHFVPCFVYHFVYGLVLLLLSKSNANDIILLLLSISFFFQIDKRHNSC